ncbi:MAG: RidA family protein [Chitinophagaceae bacterium]|nr:RidA family protein [Chitinophagaceae bacterium]
MKTIINTSKAPAPIGPYNQAILQNGMLFISGQIAIVPETGELEMSNTQSEAHQVMKNLQAILTEAKLGFEHVVKTTILLSDMSLFSTVNEVYGSYFEKEYPARETFAVKGLPKGVNIEISMIAIN